MSGAIVARVFDTQANQSFDVTFERFPVRIGRNQLNDLQIDRPYVSQFHAQIDVKDGRVLVRDLGSTNGTMYSGQRLQRDAPVDVTAAPEFAVGPIVIRLGLVANAPKKREEPKEGTVLDFGGDIAPGAPSQRPIVPGQEDPFVQQLLPFIEAYRSAWGTVYGIVYDHLTRLTPELRTTYLKRLAIEQSSVNAEPDFQKIAQYYGVDTRALGDLSAPAAALAALIEISQTLAPQAKPIDDVTSVLTFSRNLRDALEVFLKCFVSLRDGYQEFETEVLARDRNAGQDRVASAKDFRELGSVLLDPTGNQDGARRLHDIFVDVMSHQVALLNGVMEGVKQLLKRLSPRTIEDELARQGKKGGLFSNKYEALWKLYETRHGDYSGEDKETFLVIFGPQFSRAYAASAGEDYRATPDAGSRTGKRFSLAPGQIKQR